MAVLTDPPYGIGYVHSGKGRGIGGRRRNGNQPLIGDDEPFDPAHLFQYSPLLIWGADHFRSRLPQGGTFIAWDKHCNSGPNDKFSDAEFAWADFRTARNVIRFLWKGVACVKQGEANGRRYHPTTKPLGVMRRCLELTPPAELYCDPYMGSGTTGVACIQAGKSFIGIEIEARYFDIACERIENAQRQERMFA